jgi:hypothetical protein
VNPEVPEIFRGQSDTDGTDLAIGAVHVRVTATASQQTLAIQQPVTIRVKADALGITNAQVKTALRGRVFPVRIIGGNNTSVTVPNATYDPATDEVVVVVQPGLLHSRQGVGVDIYLLILSGLTIEWAPEPTMVVIDRRISAPSMGIDVAWTRPAIEFTTSAPLLQLIMGLNIAASSTQAEYRVVRVGIQNFRWRAELQRTIRGGTVMAIGMAAALGLNGQTVTRQTYGTFAEAREGTGLLYP